MKVVLPLLTWLASASASNAILDCMRGNYTLADTPELAARAPVCTWGDYAGFLASSASRGWADGDEEPVTADVGANGELDPKSAHAELTSSITTALTIADTLRLTLGDQAYAERTAPVTVDMVGWAFHWTAREEVEGTSNTIEVAAWDATLQRETRLRWGAHIGGALRRLLPRVEAITVRGYGPEAPRVNRTALRADGWLSLELYPGVYDRLSEPPPTLTLLENSGMHDDLWPSDGGCVSDKGELPRTSAAELARRTANGETEGVGLGCLWRATVELLRDSGRLVWATSYSSHEHLAAVGNLRAVGARIEHAFPNGWREEGRRVVHFDLLRQPSPIVEALHDPTPRKWASKEAQYATTAALWRHRVEQGGYERLLRLSRNSHVLAFQGNAAIAAGRADCERAGEGSCEGIPDVEALMQSSAYDATALGSGAAAASTSLAHEQYSRAWYEYNQALKVRARLQAAALAASHLPSMPPRQTLILREVPWLQGGGSEGGGGGGGGGDDGGSGGSAAAAKAVAETRRPPEAEALFVAAEALREDGKPAAARAQYDACLALAPDDAPSYRGLGAVLGELGEGGAQLRAYRTAVKLRPADAMGWSKLGVALSALEADEAVVEAEAAFRRACTTAPEDARAPLNLGRYLAKLSRPAEAIASFYEAAGADAEYYEEAALGIGTARAQQGRLREAVGRFEAALRISPGNERLRASIGPMTMNAEAVEVALGGAEDAVADLCGTPCQKVIDGAGYTVCAIMWADGCGEIPPPQGFTAQSTVAELCRKTCAFYAWGRMQQQPRQ